jgi:hypothetical protein
MSEAFVVNVEYSIKYTTTKPVPIPEIVSSLESLARILKRTPAFVEKSFGDIEIVETDVFVAKIEAGSLVEDFIVRYVFKDRGNYNAAKQVFDNIMVDNTAIRTVVAMGVGSLITYGVLNVLPAGSPTTHLEAYNNTIVNIGATVDLQAGDIRAILDAAHDKRSLSRDAVHALRPSRSDPSATVEMSSILGLEMPSLAVAETPAEYEPLPPAEREVRYSNADVVIYASDRDRSESGWAGIAPGLVDKRTPMILDAAVSPSALHGRTRVRADIVIHERFVPSKKKYEAKQIELVLVN